MSGKTNVNIGITTVRRRKVSKCVLYWSYRLKTVIVTVPLLPKSENVYRALKCGQVQDSLNMRSFTLSDRLRPLKRAV